MEIKMFIKASRKMSSQTEWGNKENLISNIGNVLKIADCANDICACWIQICWCKLCTQEAEKHTYKQSRARNLEFCFCSTSVACVTFVLYRFQRKTYVLLLSQQFSAEMKPIFFFAQFSYIDLSSQNFYALARFLYL